MVLPLIRGDVSIYRDRGVFSYGSSITNQTPSIPLTRGTLETTIGETPYLTFQTARRYDLAGHEDRDFAIQLSENHQAIFAFLVV